MGSVGVGGEDKTATRLVLLVGDNNQWTHGKHTRLALLFGENCNQWTHDKHSITGWKEIVINGHVKAAFCTDRLYTN